MTFVSFFRNIVLTVLFLAMNISCGIQQSSSKRLPKQTLLLAYANNKGEQVFQKAKYEVINSEVIVFDDIIVAKESELKKNGIVYLNNVSPLSRMVTNKDFETSAIKPISARLWKDGNLPYVIDKSFTGESLEWLEEQIIIFNEIMEAEDVDVRLVPRGRQRAYGKFVYTPLIKRSCGSSYVGYRGVPSNINITCLRTRTFQHEVLHLLGIVHEHQRPDRDEYVFVDSDDKTNYGIYEPTEAYLPGPYDLASVMHYPLGGLIKIKPGLKDPGGRLELSEGDLDGLADLYNIVKPEPTPEPEPEPKKPEPTPEPEPEPKKPEPTPEPEPKKPEPTPEPEPIALKDGHYIFALPFPSLRTFIIINGKYCENDDTTIDDNRKYKILSQKEFDNGLLPLEKFTGLPCI